MDLRHGEDYYIRVLLTKVKIKEIMTSHVIAIHEEEPFSRVEEKFREFGIRHLPVVDNSNKLVGLVTQRDLYRTQSPRKDEDGNWFYDKQGLDSYILKHVMTKNLTALKPDDSVAQALLLMVRNKYGSIPIVDDDNVLCGIITQVDILKIAAKIIQE